MMEGIRGKKKEGRNKMRRKEGCKIERKKGRKKDKLNKQTRK